MAALASEVLAALQQQAQPAAPAREAAADGIIYDIGSRAWAKASSYLARILPEWRDIAIEEHTNPADDWPTRWQDAAEFSPHLAALEYWAKRSDEARRHPLFRTHHRKVLLKRFWYAQQIPTRTTAALAPYTPWILQHGDMDNETIREMVKYETPKWSKETWNERLGSLAPDGEITPRKARMSLRRATRRFNESAAHVLKLVGKTGRPYVSQHTREHRDQQLQLQQRWIQATKAIKEDGTVFELTDCVRSERERFAELYALIKGQETYFTAKKHVPTFITLTAPATFHINPSHGEDQWDGSSPTKTQAWFTEQWARARAALAKKNIRLEGVRVAEPHKDGTPHWHLMLYLTTGQLPIVREVILEYFGHSPHAVEIKADFTNPKKGKRATAASYMLKYIIKTVRFAASSGTSAVGDLFLSAEADDTDAWRATWGIRGFQFFGTLFGKQTLWRELRRLETQPDEPTAKRLWRAARGTRAHDFIATLAETDPDLAAIRETKWTEPDAETGEIFKTKGRVVGVQIQCVPYITRGSKWTLETDYSLLNEMVTVIHRDPRGGNSGKPEPPPNPIPTPQNRHEHVTA